MPRLIAGNWKMNGVRGALDEISKIADGVADGPAEVEALVCPPMTLLHAAIQRNAKGRLKLGAQDCHARAHGAHTGDISAEMIADLGASHVIVGHSERRQDHGERDGDVSAKAGAALRAGLVPIICVGETAAERKAGRARAVILSQLEYSIPDTVRRGNFAVAYEPVWAIGAGEPASLDQIAEAHGWIRERLAGYQAGSRPILYGGSVKPDNAAEIFSVEDVDGALIGGASLKANDFLKIYIAALS